MAVINCNLSKIVQGIFDKKKYGIQITEDEYSSFIKSYLATLDCGFYDCEGLTEPCDKINTLTCDTFVLPSFGFTSQSYGTDIDFIVDENTLNGLAPYSYTWTYDSQYYSLRVLNSNHQSTLKLTKLQEVNLDMNYITNVIVSIVDSNGCTFLKTCQFTYTKEEGISDGNLNCESTEFIECNYPETFAISNLINNSFDVSWVDAGFQYELTVSTDFEGFNVIYHNSFAHPITHITGLNSGTTYYVRLTNKSCNLSSVLNPHTTSVPLAIINCGSAVFTPINIYTGVPYTGSMILSYTNGNGQSYSTTGFTAANLTFILSSGTLNIGNGNLVFNITGTPSGNISLPINLFGSNCTVLKAVIPVCNPISTTTVTIGNYNYTTGKYDVTVSWPPVSGAIGYTIFDGINTFQTTQSFFIMSVEPNTSFTGAITTNCSFGASSAISISYNGLTPEIPCTLSSIVTGNITEDGFSLLAINPVLNPGDFIHYEIYNIGSGGGTPVLVDSGDTSTFPVIFTGLTPDTYQVQCQKFCGTAPSDVVGNNVTIEAAPPTPTVYINFAYQMSQVVPSDSYITPCDVRGSHFDMISKPGIVKIFTFSDIAGTIPLNVTGMGITINLQTRYKYGTFSCPSPGTRNTTSNTVTPGTLILSGTSTPFNAIIFEDTYSGAQDCGVSDCIPSVWSQRLFELLPGTGYTII